MPASSAPVIRGFFNGYLDKEAATAEEKRQKEEQARVKKKFRSRVQELAAPAAEEAPAMAPPPGGWENYYTGGKAPEYPAEEAHAMAPPPGGWENYYTGGKAPEYPADIPQGVDRPVGDNKASLQAKVQELTGGAPAAKEPRITPEWAQPGSPISQLTGEPLPMSPADKAITRQADKTRGGRGPNWEGLWSTLKEYAPYMAGGAALGGLGSVLADKLQGVQPRVRKAMIVMALTGGVGALLKATGGAEGLRNRLGGSSVV